MGLKIRLARWGAKKRPYYRIVVADSRSPRDGRYTEKLGSYDPMLDREDPARVVIALDRAKHWLSQGALPTDRVRSFLVDNGLLSRKKIPVQTKKHLPSKKTEEKLRARKEKRLEREKAIDKDLKDATTS